MIPVTGHLGHLEGKCCPTGMILQVVSHVHHHFSVIFCYIFVFVETCVVKTPGVSILVVVFYIQLSNEETLVV